MNISFHIPEWVLWLVGIPLGFFIAIMAVFGFMFVVNFKYK